jgi:REP element-mobilizing transposase RayT
MPTQNVVQGARQHLGEVFRHLAERKQSRIEEGHRMADHMHMMISIPPKYAVSEVVGYIMGKSAIHLARVYGERKQNLLVSTSGREGTWCPRSAGMNRDPRVHPQSGRGRQKIGPTQPVEVTCHRQGGST